ncbi:MAG: molybdenum cofactor guanylyltransferase [Sutterellaceae bacterium]|nr:molybdenum cofactor guanylyltransferase [Sutterellaceae bacterium]MDD7441208.1 molybdenum cofactor guanylyltransferase [Sutterellaceae bacterium]MDY2868816.1 molybdenum cofactor guanylyltransferase MobA [Mesosutterella sp.]
MKRIGLVLAGGRATRMGGADKGLVTLCGEPLALRALRRLAPQADEVWVSANRSFPEYRAVLPEGTRVLPDLRKEFPGLLAGLEAAMAAVPEGERQDTWFITVPCDSPFFPGNLSEELFRTAVSLGSDAVFAEAEGSPEPAFAALRATLLPRLSAYLDRGGHRVRMWLEELGAARAGFPDLADFRNCNTPEELEEAVKRASEGA